MPNSALDWIADQVAKVREVRRRQGHDLSKLQEGIVESFVARDPAHEPASRRLLSIIEETIKSSGQWAEQEEWRISTWFNSSIARAAKNGSDIYEVSVECDGQTLTCACPTLEAAYAYMRLYQAFIVDQFYSVGPPWAAKGIVKS
jgi:hypothetical protein